MRQRGELFRSLAERVRAGASLGGREARTILETRPEEVFHLLASANDVRRHFKGETLDLCGIVNAKSGACPEDCGFCSQSVHHKSDVPVYGLLREEEIVSRAREARDMGAQRFGIVTSGPGIENEDDFETICASIRSISRGTALGRCASLGSLDDSQLEQLKAAGLQSIHHNIETAESFFENICTTHTYGDRVRMIKAAKDMGFKVCSGGIFGMGESPEQRVEMALALRELNVDSIPLNFLNPVPGTRLEKAEPLAPLEILNIIAMFRLLLPDKDIRVCGGRERNLRSLQPLMFAAGANGTMVGNYLTTQGRDFKEDLQMIADLGLEAGNSL